MNLRQAQKVAVAAARRAGRLIRQNLFSSKRVNSETSHDIKLELDVRCQNLIARTLLAAFPEVAFLGEEGTAGAGAAPFRWVVDPIDGTVNFAHCIPHASVSIALQRKAARVPAGRNARISGVNIAAVRRQRPNQAFYETVAGVVYDPFTDELWTALEGEPARLNGRVIRVSARRRLAEAMVSIGFAKNRASLDLALPYFNWLSRRVRKVRMMGSAALALTYVATGRFDAYIERGISLWDVAAAGFIVERAGGVFQLEPARGAYKYRMMSTNGLLQNQLPPPE